MAPLASPAPRLVDARWRGFTGVGRVTDLFLRGLAASPEASAWTVWTRRDDVPTDLGATSILASGHPPTDWFAQRDLRSVPPADAQLWMHAVRPLTRRADAVFVHDLIPVTRYPAVQRPIWREFFRRSVRHAGRVVVDSRATQEKVEALLGVPGARIRVVLPTIDTGLADRTRALRDERAAHDGHLLYVGQFKPHKNVRAAIEAFIRSEAGRAGREFVLVGGQPEERERLASHAGDAQVRVLERCSDEELAELYAGAGALIQPSLEEGFGLTVLEALVAGIPVACSAIAAHEEASRGLAVTFDPNDTGAMAEAIDRAFAMPAPARPAVATAAEYAAEVLVAAGLA